MANTLRFFYLLLLIIILLCGSTSLAQADAPNKPGGTVCHSGYLTIHDKHTGNVVIQGVFYLNDVAAIGGEASNYLLSTPGQSYALLLPANLPHPGSPGSALVNGDCVRITGSLVKIKGAEKPDRTVIKVTTAESAK